METQIMLLEVINPYILLGIGVALIGFEAIITSFILIWFGLGFIITAFISMAYNFSEGVWQLGVVAIISVIFMILLRKKALEKFLSSESNITDNFLEEGGIGEIKNSKVFFKGTYWEIDPESEEFDYEEGQKVLVSKTHKNNAIIQKK